MNDEQEIIQRIMKGERELFSEIITKYQQNIFHLCYKITGNRSESEESTQEVFVQLYESLPKFRFEAQLGTFIYRLTVNVLSKKHRKNKKLVFIPEYFENKNTVNSSIENNMILEERRVHLQNAIAKLPENQRIALVLHNFEELSYKEIGDTLNISLSAVESLIHRAKCNLKKQLLNLQTP